MVKLQLGPDWYQTTTNKKQKELPQFNGTLIYQKNNIQASLTWFKNDYIVTCNHIPCFMLDVITHQCPNITGGLAKSKFSSSISPINDGVVTCLCPSLTYNLVSYNPPLGKKTGFDHKQWTSGNTWIN